MSDDTRDLAQRIRDALEGTHSDSEWIVVDEERVVLNINLDDDWGSGDEAPIAERGAWAYAEDMHLIAAAPSLLRDALARIEADAARIAALEAKLAALERTTCPECLGAGRVAAIGFDERLSALCPTCAGRGTVPHDGE